LDNSNGQITSLDAHSLMLHIIWYSVLAYILLRNCTSDFKRSRRYFFSYQFHPTWL